MLESHVTNLQQSSKLYELGFVKDCNFVYRVGKSTYLYHIDKDLREEISYQGYGVTEKSGVAYYPAYLLSEIMEALKTAALSKGTESEISWFEASLWKGYKEVGGKENNLGHILLSIDLKLACDLLIWCIENGFISTDKDAK